MVLSLRGSRPFLIVHNGYKKKGRRVAVAVAQQVRHGGTYLQMGVIFADIFPSGETSNEGPRPRHMGIIVEFWRNRQ
jgi:hypothetical protein